MVPTKGRDGIPEGGFVTATEQVSTTVHHDPIRLECGLSYAEVDFGHSFGKGVGGLHQAEIQYKAFSWAELALLRTEAHKLLAPNGHVIDLTKVDEASQEAFDKAVAMLKQVSDETINRALVKQREELAAVARNAATRLCNEVNARYKSARFGNRKDVLYCIHGGVETYADRIGQVYDKAVAAADSLPTVSPTPSTEELVEMLVRAWKKPLTIKDAVEPLSAKVILGDTPPGGPLPGIGG